jgi:hypothetical protein
MEEARQKIRSVLSANSDTSKRIHENLLEVSPEVAKKATEITGIDVSGYRYTIDKSEVNHAINRHSNSKIERDRNQLPITADDLLNIPEIVEAPDRLTGLGKDKMGRETIAFEKNIGNGKTFVYEAVLKGRKELAFQTMFKKKADEFMPNNDPTPTSETTSGFSESKGTKNSEISKKRFGKIAGGRFTSLNGF